MEGSVDVNMQPTATKCLTASSLSNGARVVIESCGANATSLNSWTISGGTDARGQISTNGFVSFPFPIPPRSFFTPTLGLKYFFSVWTWSTGSTQTVLNYKSGNVHPGTLVSIFPARVCFPTPPSSPYSPVFHPHVWQQYPVEWRKQQQSSWSLFDDITYLRKL